MVNKNQPQSQNNKRSKVHKAEPGLTLPEALMTVAIAGILSSISIPAYFRQLTKSCQGTPGQAINQSMGAAQAYYDEYGEPATSWSDLNKMATLMTKSGPAIDSGFGWIDLPSCDYRLKAEQEDNQYTFIAKQTGAFKGTNSEGDEEFDETKNTYNIVGCLNLDTGASEIKRGDGTDPASTSNLNCF